MNAIPYLLYDDAAAAIEFLTRAFGFRELDRTVGADGVIANCELVGPAGGDVWLGQMRPSGTSVVYLYVDDVDAHRAQAGAEGAAIVDEPAEHPISDESPARRT